MDGQGFICGSYYGVALALLHIPWRGFCTAMRSAQELLPLVQCQGPLKSCPFVSETGHTQLSLQKVDELGLGEECCPQSHS